MAQPEPSKRTSRTPVALQFDPDGDPVAAEAG